MSIAPSPDYIIRDGQQYVSTEVAVKLAEKATESIFYNSRVYKSVERVKSGRKVYFLRDDIFAVRETEDLKRHFAFEVTMFMEWMDEKIGDPVAKEREKIFGTKYAGRGKHAGVYTYNAAIKVAVHFRNILPEYVQRFKNSGGMLIALEDVCKYMLKKKTPSPLKKEGGGVI